jgi:hypothetical protein
VQTTQPPGPRSGAKGTPHLTLDARVGMGEISVTRG